MEKIGEHLDCVTGRNSLLIAHDVTDFNSWKTVCAICWFELYAGSGLCVSYVT